nr:hypothetical protein [Tanacetum cinerariifolium]
MESLKESILDRAKHKREKDKRVNNRMMQSKERKDNSSTALDAGLVVTESNETESERHVLSSRFENDTHTDDADINSVNDKQPMAEVQLSAEHNILANEQHHSEQSESIYDTYLLEKVDKNSTLESTDMSHRGGKIDQNADDKKYHSRNPTLFSDSKHFVYSTCQKCVFNANHDACITKFRKEVNSRAKIQPNKTRNSNKPVDSTSRTQNPGRKIVTGHSFSPNKSFVVHEKTNTHRSCLTWIPTGRIFNTPGLKQLERHSHLAQQRLIVNPQMVQMIISLTLINAIKLSMSVQVLVTSTPVLHDNDVYRQHFRPRSSKKRKDMLFQSLFDELLTPLPSVDHLAPKVIAPIAKVVALKPAALTGSPSLTTIDQDAPSPSNSQQHPTLNLLSFLTMLKMIIMTYMLHT